MRTLKALACVTAATAMATAGVASAETTRSVNMLPKSSYAQRDSAPAQNANKLQGNSTSAVLIGLLGVAAVVAGALTMGDKSDSPG